MKFSLFKNDTSTYWDEVILILLVLVDLLIAILLLQFKPSFWIISEGVSAGFGVLALVIAVMYTPCIIYRLCTNKIEKKNNSDEK